MNESNLQKQQLHKMNKTTWYVVSLVCHGMSMDSMNVQTTNLLIDR